eukprot:257937-Chlamydomonas_euryale.AAC.7
MPLYEIVCLAKPALARPHLARMMQRVGDLVMSDGGIVADVVSYGEQHLAYDIRKPFEKYDKVGVGAQGCAWTWRTTNSPCRRRHRAPLQPCLYPRRRRTSGK